MEYFVYWHGPLHSPTTSSGNPCASVGKDHTSSTIRPSIIEESCNTTGGNLTKDRRGKEYQRWVVFSFSPYGMWYHTSGISLEEVELISVELGVILLYAASIVLHAFGMFLLRSQQRMRNQDIIMFHLSASEILISILDTAVISFGRDKDQNHKWRKYADMVQCEWLVVTYLLINIVLTVDRFMEVYLNIKYNMYFTKLRTRCILATCWFLGAVSFTLFIVIYNFTTLHYKQDDWKGILFPFVYCMLEALFLITAVLTYTYIYHQYRRSFCTKSKLGRISLHMIEVEQQYREKTTKRTSTTTTSSNIFSGKFLKKSSSSASTSTVGTTVSAISCIFTDDIENLDFGRRKSGLSAQLKKYVRRSSSRVGPAALTVRPQKSTQKVNVKKKKKRKGCKNVVKSLRKHSFFSPLLIFVSFILFVFLPDIVNFYHFHHPHEHHHHKQHHKYHHKSNKKEVIHNAIKCLYAIGFIADAAIYIFCQKQVRRIMRKKYRRMKSHLSVRRGKKKVQLNTLATPTSTTTTTSSSMMSPEPEGRFRRLHSNAAFCK